MYAVLYFPQFPLQAVLRHEPALWGRPVALVDPGMNTPRVMEATPSARDAGITDGLTAPQALARCRTVSVRHRVPAQEATATDAILQCAYGFSPHLESTAVGVITLDLRGLSELKPGPPQSDPGAVAKAAGSGAGRSAADRIRAWGERLLAALAELGLAARVGLGPTPNVARHAARWGKMSGEGLLPQADREEVAVVASTTTESSDLRETAPAVGATSSGSSVLLVAEPASFLGRLPVSALEPSSDVAEILQRWGIRTVGELLALGQAELAERLGLEALGLFAAASVTASRPLNLVKPAERFEEAHEFESEIETMEPLLFILQRFADALCRRLDAFGWVAGSLRLRLRLESGQALEHLLRLPQPTRRPEVLFRMLHTHLEGFRTDSPVKSVGLMAEPTRPEQRQFGLFESALRDPHQFQETLARLAALVGADRVGSPVRENSHRPDAFTLVPPDFESESGMVAGNTTGLGMVSRPDWCRPFPMRRLRPALVAGVDVEPDGRKEPLAAGNEGQSREERPVSLRCSMANGRLVVALGPWKTSGHWWESGGWEREEWDIAMRGGRVYRLARVGETWRVEGVLD